MNDRARVENDQRAGHERSSRVQSELRVVMNNCAPASRTIYAPSPSISACELIEPCRALIEHVPAARSCARASLSRDAGGSFVDFLTVSVDAA